MTLRIAKTIAHEVGHHLIAEKKFALRKKTVSDEVETEEEFANRYSRAVIARMKQVRVYQVGAKLLRLAALINYQRGARAWNKGRFAQAAKFFEMTIKLKPSHDDANYWFWRAREEAKRVENSQ